MSKKNDIYKWAFASALKMVLDELDFVIGDSTGFPSEGVYLEWAEDGKGLLIFRFDSEYVGMIDFFDGNARLSIVSNVEQSDG